MRGAKGVVRARPAAPDGDRPLRSHAPRCPADGRRPQRRAAPADKPAQGMTLNLHIGMHKTGSTAFQAFCHHNGEALAQAGLVYLSLGGHNHGPFLEAQFAPGPDTTQRLTRKGEGRHITERAEWRASFHAQLDAALAAGRDPILSAEGASTMGAPALQALKDALAPTHPQVRVLGLVRTPKAFAASSAQQVLKRNGTLAELVAAPHAPRYRRRFQPHLDVFGERAVTLRPYDPRRLTDGCVLQTLLAMMRVEAPSLAAARAPRVNVSVSMTAAKVLSAFNRAFRERTLPHGLPAALREAIHLAPFRRHDAALAQSGEPHFAWPPALLARVTAIEGPPFALPADAVAAMCEAEREDIEWMSRHLGCDLSALDAPAPAAGPTAPFASGTDREVFDDSELATIARHLGHTAVSPAPSALTEADRPGGPPPAAAPGGTPPAPAS